MPTTERNSERSPESFSQLDEAYGQFCGLYAKGQAVQGRTAFLMAVRAAGLRRDEVTLDWLKSLRDDWVYGYSTSPFVEDEIRNRAYLKLMQSIGSPVDHSIQPT